MTFRRHLIPAALLLTAATFAAGCTPEPLRTGRVQVCFDAPEEAEPQSDSPMPGDLEASLDGTVVKDAPADEVDVEMPCDAARVLQVEVDNELWSVGYQVQDHDGADITPQVGFIEGEPVTLTLQREQGWGLYQAFAADADSGALLAMNDGYGATLPDGVPEGLSVKEGEEYGAEASSGCGTKVGHTLVFTGTSTTELRSGERGKVALADGSAEAMSVASWSFDEVTCTDTWGPNAWMVHRQAAQ